MENKQDFLDYIRKCIKHQGIYATAALAPLLNKLVEKVFLKIAVRNPLQLCCIRKYETTLTTITSGRMLRISKILQ